MEEINLDKGFYLGDLSYIYSLMYGDYHNMLYGATTVDPEFEGMVYRLEMDKYETLLDLCNQLKEKIK